MLTSQLVFLSAMGILTTAIVAGPKASLGQELLDPIDTINLAISISVASATVEALIKTHTV